MMSYFIQLLFSASLLLLAAMVVSLIFRRASASFRYKLWNFTMLGLLLMPPLVPYLEPLDLGVLPLTGEELALTSTIQSGQTAPAPYYLLGRAPQCFPPEQPAEGVDEPRLFPPLRATPPQRESVADNRYDSENLRQAELEWERMWMADTPSSLTLDRIPVNTVAVKHAEEEQQRSVIFPSLPGVLFFLWTAVTMILLLRFVFSLLAARRLLRRMLPVESEAVRKLADETARRMWVYRRIKLLQNEVGTVPFTLGLRTPRIVLPRTAVENWSESQLRAILSHEIAHIQRGDVWGQLLTRLVFCL